MNVGQFGVWVNDPTTLLASLRGVAPLLGLAGGTRAVCVAQLNAWVTAQPDHTALVPPAVSAITGPPPPTLAINPPTPTQAYEGVVYTYTLTARHGAGGNTWTATGLPAGLTLNAGTGQITGTPAAGTAGNANVNVTVTDGAGTTANVAFDLVVNAAPLRITTAVLPNPTESVLYDQTPAVVGGAGGTTWTATGLPGWLILNPVNGRLRGTPPNGSSANPPFTIQLTAQDAAGHTDTKPLTLVVDSAPLAITTTPPLPDAVAGTMCSPQIEARGGRGPYTWTATGLPAWLTLTGGNGPRTQITGTPGAGDVGTHNFTLTVTDAFGDTDSQPLQLTVTAAPPLPPGPLEIRPITGIAPGQVRVPYPGITPHEQGGTPPYDWSIAAGHLPPGMYIDDGMGGTGEIDGTPTMEGNFPFTLQVEDSSTPPQTATRPLRIRVNPAPPRQMPAWLKWVGIGAVVLVAIAALIWTASNWRGFNFGGGSGTGTGGTPALVCNDQQLGQGSVTAIPSGCNAVGDVSVGDNQNGPFRPLYDNEATTALVVTCAQQTCWVKADNQAGMTSTAPGVIVQKLFGPQGCGLPTGCLAVNQTTWPGGNINWVYKSGTPPSPVPTVVATPPVVPTAAPPVLPTATPPGGGTTPPPGGSLPAGAIMCGEAIPDGGIVQIPADCRISGDVAWSTSQSGPFRRAYDDRAETGTLIHTTAPVWVRGDNGGGSTTTRSVESVRNQMMRSGCGLPNGCPIVNPISVP